MKEKGTWGGTRKGAGRLRVRRRISKEAALQIRLIAWEQYGRPTTDEEEDEVLNQIISRCARDGKNDN